MEKLKEALKILLNEELDIKDRFDILIPLNGQNYIKGLARAILTPILLVVYPGKYGVYNTVTDDALVKLKLKPEVSRGTSFAEEYVIINAILLDIAQKYDLSLFQLDEVWWNVLDEKVSTEQLRSLITNTGKEIRLMVKKNKITVSGEDELFKLLEKISLHIWKIL